MTLIRYRRHFVALCIAAPLLCVPFTNRFPIPRGDLFFCVYFAWLGALHATTIVVAMRSTVPFWKAVAFVVLAAFWSVSAPALGMLLAVLGTHVGIEGGGWLIFMPLSASVFGACGYWFMLRLFWIPKLRADDLGSAVGLCVTATALSWAGMLVMTSLGAGNDLSQLAPTLMWWAAFSVSLYRTETRALDATTGEAATA